MGCRAVVVDTSALVAIVLGESDADVYATALARADSVSISAVTLVESSVMVEAHQGADAARDLQLLIEAVRARIAPVDVHLATTAIAAWRRFGKGRHPASLNFGDCFSYALARHLDEPMLFKGQDFTQTDIRSAR